MDGWQYPIAQVSEGLDVTAISRVPQSHGAIERGRGAVAVVGREAAALDGVLVALELEQHLVRRGARPHGGRVVVARRDEPIAAIRKVGDRHLWTQAKVRRRMGRW